MIRSSRIPPLLDKICTDGIVSSLLISKDGELLGSSTINAGATKNAETIPQGVIEDSNNMIPIGSSSAESSSPLPSLPSWVNMNPSDIGALIAEVVEDYKQLGYELSMLDPSFSVSSATASAATGGVSSGAGTSASGSSTNNSAAKNMSTENSDVGVGNGGEGKQQEDGAKNNLSSKATGGNDTGTIKETGGNKDKGRLNCLIMELDSGIIGVTSATSSTYVIALAESTTQHGLLKDRLTVLASLLDLNIV
mmetsp:Transcript_6952/g.8675  ORF Transcript_6952/g.8675 Transcript_6952/m.8675 type:complete len:251 (+) Transcript_6952:40-792(+)|eukprot:CAMPEP_0203662798 /NCGR_PEP_ID=MMETSP0090-20130426/635_1 /ASSEMBLY_ACC=CAM_ASM_001088 /TAXON_ID=426623 /ORGANISM="Chaetoceros affinis, Strain CCMP159" /LENGTH=250 /DNA_ID=CAMNT_0050525633 /DNA_START=66 /DNA_END=818 /DNA_ORIENTATION=-